MYNAVFYEDMYLLIPAEYPDYNAFVEAVSEMELPAQLDLVVLYENHHLIRTSVIKGCSMAPYFLSGYHDDPVPITITDAKKLYSAEVEILSQQEYNARLREVINQVCPGCLRFKPLSNRVQSLNGHFEEMTLDGVCVFRQESRPAPRIFHDHLFSFGGFFRMFDYAGQNAQEMQDSIKERFYLRYADAVLQKESERKVLTLTCRKQELLPPVLTVAISRYVNHISADTYHIQLSDAFDCTESVLSGLLSEENDEVFRKECKKYGVSLGIMEYDEAASDIVWESLQPLVEHFWIFPLTQMPGKCYCLITDLSQVLKELRYRSPLLQTYNTTVSVYDQYNRRKYQISYEMNQSPV